MEDFTTGYENIVGQSAVLRWKYLTEIPAGIYYYMAHSFCACYFRKCCKCWLLIAENCRDYWTYLARPFFGFNSRVRHGEVFSWVNLPAISQKVNNDITMRASLSTALHLSTGWNSTQWTVLLVCLMFIHYIAIYMVNRTLQLLKS